MCRELFNRLGFNFYPKLQPITVYLVVWVEGGKSISLIFGVVSMSETVTSLQQKDI